jgi:hypothetical protein
MSMISAGPFGCSACFRADAETAARARRKFVHSARLADESHFGVNILACPACGQRCVSIFTEMIDWAGGDDPQYVSVLPVTQVESDMLIAGGDDLIARIESLGRGRPFLQVDYLKGGSQGVRWVNGGLRIGSHD